MFSSGSSFGIVEPLSVLRPISSSSVGVVLPHGAVVVGLDEGFAAQILLFGGPDVSEHVLDVALHALGLVDALQFLEQVDAHPRLVAIKMENVLPVAAEIRSQILATFLVLHVDFG